jgi:uncharacterized protein
VSRIAQTRPNPGPDWSPTPFREFVVKLHNSCNLACDYCYMYNLADRGWRGRAAAMSAEVLDQVGTRIAEHVAAHGQPRVRIVFHGGEPLLAGVPTLAAAAGMFRAECAWTRRPPR